MSESWMACHAMSATAPANIHAPILNVRDRA
jgi:hypothetical protein